MTQVAHNVDSTFINISYRLPHGVPGTEWYAWFRSIKVAGGWLGGWDILCSYSYVHDHHSVWVTDSLMHGECCRLSASDKFN